MKYYHILCLVLILTLTDAAAATSIRTSSADTSVNELAHKHSKQYFLDNYGKDDSTRALINYFFKKRKAAIYETFLSPAAAGTSLLLLHFLLENMGDTGSAGFSVALFLAVTVFYAVPVCITAQIKWLIFNRRKLLTILEAYNAGTPLPKSVTRRQKFKQAL